MRFHIPSLPHTQTTKDYSWCAYTEKVRKFANMLHDRGHEVFLYAGEDNEARCTEHIPVVTKAEQAEWFGHLDWQRDLFPADGWEPERPWWRTMNERAQVEIAKRAEPDDILGIIMGRCQDPLAQAFPWMLPNEWGIGYEGVCTNYRVWESYAWMHYVYGKRHEGNGANYDAVIPNSFELEDFPAGDGRGDYYLFLGRVILRKGPHIAAEVCQRLGAQLVVAGQGVHRQEPGKLYGLDDVVVACDRLDYAGVVRPEARAELLGGAKAVFMPTIYIEPFGGVAVEAMLCGTPVIAPDFGAFTETVVPGVSGYRCRTLAEWVQAAQDAPELDRTAVRAHALRYTTDAIGDDYERFYERLVTLRGDGWYTLPAAA